MTAAASTPRPPVLIFGAHLAALGALRVIAQHGIRCFVVDDTDNIIARSRWYRPTERKLVESPDSDALAEVLGSLRLKRAVLLCCSDQWALAVAGLPAELKERFPASLSSRDTIEQFVDKDRFRDLVDRLDIPRPRTVLIHDRADLEGVSDDDLTNGFLKPTELHLHNRRFGTKGAFVGSREAAAALVDQASAAGITYMLQEFIPGDMSQTVLIDGFVDRAGTIKTILARRRVRMDPPRLANTCSDVTIPLADVEDCLPGVRAMLAATDYRGIFNVEFKFDRRDGRFKIIELNPRSTWYAGHIARAGIDLPWMSYLDAQGLPVPAQASYQIGRYGLYEILDATAIVRAWSGFHRPQGRVVEPWLHGDRTLFWWRDPMPAVSGVSHIIAKRLGRLTGRGPRRSQPAI